jgi:hypothetical protein
MLPLPFPLPLPVPLFSLAAGTVVAVESLVDDEPFVAAPAIPAAPTAIPSAAAPVINHR